VIVLESFGIGVGSKQQSPENNVSLRIVIPDYLRCRFNSLPPIRSIFGDKRPFIAIKGEMTDRAEGDQIVSIMDIMKLCTAKFMMCHELRFCKPSCRRGLNDNPT